MRKIEDIVEDVAEIYRKSGGEAERYLNRARQLKGALGPGPAIVYCWFYSVPQKWTQVEPKIFELLEQTRSCDLDVILSMPPSRIASMLGPMIFYNEISFQLKNFCSAVKCEYSSWDHFAEELREKSIFAIFERMRKYRNVRVTFKNLAAMKVFVGMDDDLFILDTHVAKVMGVSKYKANKYRYTEKIFSKK